MDEILHTPREESSAIRPPLAQLRDRGEAGTAALAQRVEPLRRRLDAATAGGRHADDHGPGGEASGLSGQAVPGTLAGKGFQVCRPYGETHHPTGDEDQGDRTGTGRHARKQTGLATVCWTVS